MPEGPEVYELAQLLRRAGYADASAHGKHLLCRELHFTFGLTGGLRLPTDRTLPPVHTASRRSQVNGAVKTYDGTLPALVKELKLGADWMTASATTLQAVINASASRKVKLGAWMLDQTEIAGVGVAWGSEIAALANLDVAARMCDQNLRNLGAAYVSVRNSAIDTYNAYIDSVVTDAAAVADAVNGWYLNLERVRVMRAYNVGTPVTVTGRNFWRVNKAAAATAATAAVVVEDAAADGKGDG